MFVGDFKHGNLYHFDLNKARTELIYAGKLEYSILETRKTAEENIEFGEDFGGITDLEDLVAAINIAYLTMVVPCRGLFL